MVLKVETFFFFGGPEQGPLNDLNGTPIFFWGGNETMQMYGDFEGFPL